MSELTLDLDQKQNGLACLKLPRSATIHSVTEHIMAKAHRGLDGRHRDKDGKIEKKRGNTRVGSLRKEYGASFAKGRRTDMMLKTLLRKRDRLHCMNI